MSFSKTAMTISLAGLAALAHCNVERFLRRVLER